MTDFMLIRINILLEMFYKVIRFTFQLIEYRIWVFQLGNSSWYWNCILAIRCTISIIIYRSRWSLYWTFRQRGNNFRFQNVWLYYIYSTLMNSITSVWLTEAYPIFIDIKKLMKYMLCRQNGMGNKSVEKWGQHAFTLLDNTYILLGSALFRCIIDYDRRVSPI
jgi:hypothetical protein